MRKLFCLRSRFGDGHGYCRSKKWSEVSYLQIILFISIKYYVDPSITYCPLVTCQRLVKPPPPAPDGSISEWDRLRECECGYSFCMFCRRAWHGPHTLCPVLTTTKFVEEYLKFPEGSPEREAIEKRHGKKNLMSVVKKYLEDQEIQRWMEKETVPCVDLVLSVSTNADTPSL